MFEEICLYNKLHLLNEVIMEKWLPFIESICNIQLSKWWIINQYIIWYLKIWIINEFVQSIKIASCQAKAAKSGPNYRISLKSCLTSNPLNVTTSYFALLNKSFFITNEKGQDWCLLCILILIRSFHQIQILVSRGRKVHMRLLSPMCGKKSGI